MASLIAAWIPSGTPLVSPSALPTIRIRRIDTGALVVSDAEMTEVGDGIYAYLFAPDPALEYAVRMDGDPLGSAQVPPSDRYQIGSVSGPVDRLETQIPADILGAALASYEAADGTVGQSLAINLNGIEFNFATQRLELYDSSHATVIASWPVATNGGEPVTTSPGVQTKRLGRIP